MKKRVVLWAVLFLACGGFADLTWNFNTDGDYEGWVDSANRLTDSVSGGVLAFAYNNIADPQLRQTTGLGSVDLSKDFTVEVRIRRTSGSSLAYMWAYVDPSTASDHVFAAANLADNNDWQIISLNYAGGRDSGSMEALRIDPIQGTSSDIGSTWEIDYINLNQVPEPATGILFGGFCVLGFLMRRLRV